MSSEPTLGHVHLKVRDLERAVDFYTGYFALDVTEQTGSYAFLSWGHHHHDLALQAVGPDAAAPGSGVGLYHVAFEIDDLSTLRSLYRDLRTADIPVDAVDHGISKALYFDDPDGNGLEIYVDTRSSSEQQWQGYSKPFDPEESSEAE